MHASCLQLMIRQRAAFFTTAADILSQRDGAPLDRDSCQGQCYFSFGWDTRCAQGDTRCAQGGTRLAFWRSAALSELLRTASFSYCGCTVREKCNISGHSSDCSGSLCVCYTWILQFRCSIPCRRIETCSTYWRKGTLDAELQCADGWLHAKSAYLLLVKARKSRRQAEIRPSPFKSHYPSTGY